MSKKNTIILTISVLVFGFLLAGGSFAFWAWRSGTNTNVTFNTANELKDYIEYDEGESQFAGSLEASNSYLTGSIHSTITISKKAEAADVDLVASIMMDINAIGNTMKTSPALKWVVTNGTSSNPGSILAKGNFVGTNAGDTLTLVPSLEVTTSPKQYTIWIWLDQNENPSEQLSGETLDTNVWTQIDQVEGVADTFEVTRISANNQNISATAVNSKNNITNYAVTQTNTTPSSWQNIDQADQAKVYNLNTTVNQTGIWYVWFKDSTGKTTSRSIEVTTVDTTGPVCTFGSWSPTVIRNGVTSTIDLTCIDPESQITSSKLEVSDLTKSNNTINITSINKTSITNGYKYTITVTGTTTNGTATISLPANKIKNSVNLGNAIVTSGSVTIVNSYNISYTLNGGSASNPTSADYDTVISIANPIKEGYTFTGWTSTTLGTNAKTGTTNNPTTSWDGSLTKNTYFKNLIESGTVTLVANWQEANYQIVETGISYNTLNDAFAAVQNNQTIRVYKATVDESANTNPSLASTKTGIKLDLYGHTISLGTKYININNNGGLDIYSSVNGGILEGSGEQVVSNSGTLTTSDTASNTLTIRNTASADSTGAFVLYNNTNKTATLNSGTTLTCTNDKTSGGIRYIVNNSGTLNINGATLTNNPDTTNVRNGGIQNESAGKINMTSGTINVSGNGIYNQGTAADSVIISGGSITSTNFDGIDNYSTGTVSVTGGTVTGKQWGIFNSSTGTITIGDNANAVNTNSPVITSTGTSGNHNGIRMNNSSGTLNFYDGKIVSHAGTDHAILGGVSDTPVGYVVRRTTTDNIETATLVESNDYYNYLNVDTNKYYATLNDAFAAVQNNQTIRVIAQTVNESANAYPSLDSTKTGIKLDLYGHTVSLGTKYISNKGGLDIYSSVNGGVLEGSCTGSTGVVYNNGTLTTSNTSSNTLTIRNSSTYAYVIYNNTNKTVTLNLGTTLTFTNEQTSNPPRYLVNNYGTVNINGATLTNNPSSTNAYNAGILNQSAGKINMTSGTINTSGYGIDNEGTAADSVTISGGSITSTNYYGIINSSTGTVSVTGGTVTSTKTVGIINSSTGTITIGDNANAVNTNSPVITSTSTSTSDYGIRMNNSSGTLNFYDGKVVSHAGTDHAIYGTVSDTPTGYMVVKSTTNNVETATLFHGYNIEYNLDGGTASNPTLAEYDSAILIANPTKEGYMFTGWTSTTLGANAKTGTTNNPTTTWTGTSTKNTYFKNLVESGTVTLVANWAEANYQNVETGEGYATLKDAFTAVQNNQTIRVVATTVDESANTAPTLASTKTGIKLDLYGHTVSLGTKFINNNGGLDIYSSVNGGILEGTSDYGVVQNNGTLTTSNTSSNTLTIRNSSTYAYVIYNNTNKTVTLNLGTTLTFTNEQTSNPPRYLVNNYGTVNINGATLTNNPTATNSYNSGISNQSAGKINITSGTINVSGYGINNEGTAADSVTISGGNITSTNSYGIYNSSTGTVAVTGGSITSTNSYGIYNSSTGTVSVTGGSITSTNSYGIYNSSTGIITIGDNANAVNTNSPVITSTSTSTSHYGISNSSGTLNFYDGKIVSHAGTDHAISGTVSDTPTGYSVRKTTENNIETATLSNTYTIKYYKGNASATAGNTKIATEKTCTYGESCTLDTISALGYTFPRSSNLWTFAGWSTTETGTTVAYTDGQTFTYNLTSDLNLYSVGKRGFSFSTGVAPTTHTERTYQYWNPYDNTETYVTTVAVPNATAITGWTFYGYRATNDATSTRTISSTYAGKTTYKPVPTNLTNLDFRSIYQRTLTLAYDANTGTGTTANQTGTQYYNSGWGNGSSNNGANVSSVSFTLKAANTFTKAGYTLSKWAAGSTGGTQYNPGASYTAFKPAVGNTTTTQTMYAIWTPNNYTISYTLDGGSASNPTSADYDTVISIANPTKEGYMFTGWTSTTLGANAKTGTTNNPTTSWDGSLTKNTYFKNLVESGTVTLVANWTEANYQNVETGEGYATLNDALAAVENNQTIRVVATTVDESANTAPSLASTKTGVKLDLYGHTVSLGTNTLTNNGGLDIYSSVNGGILEGSINGPIITNNGTLTTSNTASNTLTIRNTSYISSYNARVIVNNSNNITTLNSGTTLTFTNQLTINEEDEIYPRALVENTGILNIAGAQLIYNQYTDGLDRGVYNLSSGKVAMTSGIIELVSEVVSEEDYSWGVAIVNQSAAADAVTISGGSITSDGEGISSDLGNLTITGGTITSSYANAIWMVDGILTLGTNNGVVNVNSPVIISTSEDYNSVIGQDSGTINFYDGKLIAYSGEGYAAISANTPTGYHVKTTLENGIETATLSNVYNIEYMLLDGTASNPTSATYGEDVVIANPIKEGYMFTGWTSNYIGENAKTGTSANPTDTWDGSLTTNTYFKNLTEDETITLIANWVEKNYLNVDTNTYYGTLNNAFAEVQNNQTIRVMKVTVNQSAYAYPSLDSTKTGIKLDLYGHTVSLGTKYITNNGGLDIYSSIDGGILEGSNTSSSYGVILNNGTLTTSNTASNTLTIRNTAASSSCNARVIVNSSGKTATLKLGTTLEFSTSCTSCPRGSYRYLIQNSGTLNVSGATLTNNPDATNSYNTGITNATSASKINMTSGTISTSGNGIRNEGTAADSVTISDGTITSTNSYGIYNSSGTVSVTGGSVTSTNLYGIYNYTGTVSVTGGTITGKNGIFSLSTGTITIGDNANAVNTNSPVITSTATTGDYYGIKMNSSSGTLNFYDGKIVSHGGTDHAIYGTVTDTPVGYVVKKTTENNIETAQLVPGYKIEYSLNGGTSSNPSTAEQNSDVQLANPTLTNCTFTGWTSSNVGSNAKTGTSANPTTPWDGSLTTNTYFKDLVESGTAIMIANWSCAYENVDTTVSYRTLNAALAAVGNNETIRVNASTTEIANATLPAGVTGVKLDLYGHTISLGTTYITNNGELDIYSSVDGGILEGSNTSYYGVVYNRGTLTTSDTASNTITIRNTAAASSYKARVIVNNSNKITNLNSGTTLEFSTSCTSSNGRYLIQNSGTLNVSGATLTNNPTKTNYFNSGINNDTSASKINMISGAINVSGNGINNIGTAADSVTISGGSITSWNYGIYNQSTGTVTVTGGSITATNNAGINNSSTGTITVTGGSITSTNHEGIYTSTGTVAVTGGTITAKKDGIYNYSTGTITIGDNTNAVNTNSPVITSTATTGNYYGILMNNSSGTLNFYDGKVVSHRGTGYAISGEVSDTPVGYIVTKTTTDNIETATLVESNDYYNYLNVDTNKYYPTLNAAFAAVQNNQTIRVNDVAVDESANTNPTLASTKTGIKLDLYGHTISLGRKYINNKGGLDIYSSVNGGILDWSTTTYSSSALYVIDNDGILTTSNTASNTMTIRASATSSSSSIPTSRVNALLNGGTATLNTGTIVTGNNHDSLINNYNTLNISGATITSTHSNVVGINNHRVLNMTSGTINVPSYGIENYGTATNGTATISGGSITSTNDVAIYNRDIVNVINGTITAKKDGIYNYMGTVTLGVDDGTINVNSPVITCNDTSVYYFGIHNLRGNLNFYDGKVVGYGGTDHAIDGDINDTADGYRVVKTTNESVETATLEKITENIYIKKDGSAWNNSNMVVYLSTSATENNYNTDGGGQKQVTSGNVAQFDNLPSGTRYYVWASPSEYDTISSEYTGISFVAGGANQTINYYTFATRFNDNNISSITLDGRPYTETENNHIVLDNHTVDIEVTPNSNYYIYKYDLVDQELNTLDTIYGTPSKYKIEGTGIGMILYSRSQTGNYQNLTTGTGYTTLSAALSAAASNQTIIANVSITETANATLPAGVTNVTLDLNGKTITMGSYYITNNGGLDIYSSNGNGTITGTSTNASYGVIYNNGTLTINKTNSINSVIINNTSNNNNARVIVNNTDKTATIYQNTTISFTTASSGARELITNKGSLYINGAVLSGLTNDRGINNTGTSSHIIMNSGSINTGENAIYNSSGTGTTNPAVKIVSGTITSNSYDGTIRNEASGTIRIEGGNIVSTDGEYGTVYNSNNGTIDLQGGTISDAPNGSGILNDGGTVNMSAGTVNGGIVIFAGSTLNMYGGTSDEILDYGTVNITGGTVSSSADGINISSSGTLNLGTNDSTVSQESPLIISNATSGTYYGVKNDGGTFNFYDGKIVSHRGTNYAINGTVSAKPNGYNVNKTTNNNVETAVLGLTYNIYLEANDSPFNNSGMTIYISTSENENNYDTVGGGSKTVTTGNVATFDNLNPNTTYYIWATPGDPTAFTTSEYTGISFMPTAGGSSTINYYSFGIMKDDSHITGVTLDGETISLSTGTWFYTGFLNNHIVSIDITTDTGYSVYKYDISDGTNSLETIYGKPTQYTINGASRGLKLYSSEESGNYQNLNTGINYSTLNAAFAAVGNNETIRANVSRTETANATLPSGVTGAKLDLNGKTITMGTYYITNNGELDIYSSVDGGILTGSNTSSSYGVILNNGTLTTSNTASNTLTIRNTAASSQVSARVIVNSSGNTATLNSGTTLEFSTSCTSSSTRYLIQNSGTLNVSGATLTNNPDATNAYNCGINNATSASKINMTSGTINTSGYSIYNSGTTADSVTITGGNITSENYYGIYNYSTGTVSVTGGNITSTNSYGIYNTSSGTVTVSGGNITSIDSTAIYNYSDTGTVTVSGGSITSTNSYGIYGENGGIINISGNVRITSTNSSAIYGLHSPLTISGGTIEGFVHGINTCKNITMTGGTIIGGINRCTNVTLGTDDGIVNTNGPVIKSNGNGIIFSIPDQPGTSVTTTLNFYDGIVIGDTTTGGLSIYHSATNNNVAANYEVVKTMAGSKEIATLAPIARMRSASEIINGESNGGSNTPFLNTSFLRGEIGTITFAKTTPSGITLINGTDISEHTDGSVMMYEVSNGKTAVKDYYIIQSGGVHFPTNSSYLFYHLPNLSNFYVDTQDSIASINYVTNTSYMFAGDSSLDNYLLYGPNMLLDSVIDMTGMFMDNEIIDNVSIGHESMYIDAPNLESMNSIFALNNNMRNVSLYINTSKDNLTNLATMFDNSTNIQNIYGIENIKYNANANLINMLKNDNNLTTNAINNALQMLSGNNDYTGTKTLRFIGIDNNLATNISSYNGVWPYLVNKGWTTGY